MHASVCTLLGEPLLNLRCATALGGARLGVCADFAPAAALQTVKAGMDTACRAATRFVLSSTCQTKRNLRACHVRAGLAYATADLRETYPTTCL